MWQKTAPLSSLKVWFMKKKILIAVTAVVLCAALVTGGVFGVLGISLNKRLALSNELTGLSGTYKNVILLIGDGMGKNHMKAGEAVYGSDFEMRTRAVLAGEAMTFSRALTGPTDSAASATALSTGVKVDNGEVARHKGENIKSNMELAIENGMATGVIAAEGVKGATPAGFSAHANDRNDLDDILERQLTSKIDLFMGGAKEYYDEHAAKIQDAGYTYFSDMNDFENSADKLWGVFAELPTDAEKSSSTAPTLAQISVAAIEYLDEKSGDNGFFLMIEESYIDKMSHNNDMEGMLAHMLAYNETVNAVLDIAEELGDTLVIATADHETGGLQYNGELAADLNDKMFTKTHHTKANVPYFIYSKLDGVPETLNNTQIAFICRYYITNRPAAA